MPADAGGRFSIFEEYFAHGLAAEPATSPDVPDDVKEHVKEDDIEAGTIFVALGSAGHLQLERTEIRWR
ncbi:MULTISPECIES: hypothetical protein [Rhizobium]|uniref:hypothetical protein n=1 Tax=Rhizobium TaxID=379 RepID=UPI0012BBB72A|nr:MULTISPECIES: hypothetical protein [Rhizobium]MBY3513288.1 hypothetical protein [Rhizobium laguerreae]MBY5739444.1 hypothetical protein [Rhizobium leguminosarum]